MTTENFNKLYLGKKVIIIGNNEGQGLIFATVSGIATYPNFKLVTYEDGNGREFVSMGWVVEDTHENRKLLECAKSMFPKQNEMFSFLVAFKNFGADMEFCAKNTKD